MNFNSVIATIRQAAGFPKDNIQQDNELDKNAAYVQSLALAVSEDNPVFIQRLVFLICVLVSLLLLWAGWAKLDTVVRAGGKVIPSSSIQKIQSLEGGIVSEILVQEGDAVVNNQPLLKISDTQFLGSYEENRIKYLELKAKASRLKAEAEQIDFVKDAEVAEAMPSLLEAERTLYESNKLELEQGISILEERVKQADSQLEESQARVRQMERSLEILKREIDLNEPLVARNIVSEVDFLKLQAREVETEGELENLKILIRRTESELEEAYRQREVGITEFKNEARKELNEINAEISRIEEAQVMLADRVDRTTLRSPVTGVVQRLLTKTIGGVISPGADILEIVPAEEKLLIEVKIPPADVANLEIGQTARIKFTAYDFAVYGSISGKLSFLSADTVTDEEGLTYYVARIRPDQDFVGHIDGSLLIKVGMTTEVDVITGEKSILYSILKPVTRVFDRAMRES